MSFEPRIVGFMCNWCAYSGADLAGVSRIASPPGLRIIRTMCSGRVDAAFILKAFSLGADGVLIAGCHPGDCHYAEGNFKAIRRVALLRSVLRQLQIDERRVKLAWVSAAEAEEYARIANEFSETIRRLGPLNATERSSPVVRTAAE